MACLIRTDRQVTQPSSFSNSVIIDVHGEGADLVVRTAQVEHRFEDLAPPDRAGVIATRVGRACARLNRA